jgi:isorenieratene synthase
MRPVDLSAFKGTAPRLPAGRRAVVVGAGLAGLAAATILAERGCAVTVLEREAYAGGRVGSWPDRLADGTGFQMERGFHAFFRQYYNLRALLRRIDPALGFLRAAPDYPIITPTGAETFTGLDRSPLVNLAKLTWRTETIRLPDLLKVDKVAALEMLRYHPDRTYARWGAVSSKAYLDQLNFPAEARLRLLHVFAHSCFNPQEEMSAADLLQMFHFYFTGNPDGLLFDIASQPFGNAIFTPWLAQLGQLGVEVRLGTPALAVDRAGEGFRIDTTAGPLTADYVVLATDPPGLAAIRTASPGLAHPDLDARLAGVRATRGFAVWRLWLDRPVRPDRLPFAGTAAVGCLDNISVYERCEDESDHWHRATGGSVVELHAYALPDHRTEADVKAELLAGLQRLYPETAGAAIRHERYLFRRDCPAFAVGSYPSRPTVRTPWPGLVLAGDFVRLPFPSALMERASAAGIMAANVLLDGAGVRPEPLWSVPLKGLLA